MENKILLFPPFDAPNFFDWLINADNYFVVCNEIPSENEDIFHWLINKLSIYNNDNKLLIAIHAGDFNLDEGLTIDKELVIGKTIYAYAYHRGGDLEIQFDKQKEPKSIYEKVITKFELQ